MSSGSRPLNRLGNIDEFTLTKLQKCRVQTAKELLECSPLFLMTNADLSLKEATTLLTKVSEKLSSRPVTAHQMLQNREARKTNVSLPCGLVALDSCMGGGFLVGMITEICGPPGVGKTQLCLSACVQSIVQRAQEENGVVNAADKFTVIYIDTEMKFDAQRLREIALHGFPSIFQQGESGNTNLDGLLRSVSVIQPTSSRDLLQRILNMQSDVISNGVRLVILDSVAALARREQLMENEKEEFIVGQAAALKTLAESCNCVVLATNQIQPCGNKPEAHEEELEDVIIDQGVAYRPSLGTVWQHCVTSRLVMCTDLSPLNATVANAHEGVDKVIILDKSPIYATNTTRIHFRIQVGGFE